MGRGTTLLEAALLNRIPAGKRHKSFERSVAVATINPAFTIGSGQSPKGDSVEY